MQDIKQHGQKREKMVYNKTWKQIEFYFHKYALRCVADIMSIYTWEIVVKQEKEE